MIGETYCRGSRTYLQRHEERLTLDVREAQVHAAGVAVRITIPDDMVDLRVDTVDEALRELLDSCMVALERSKVSILTLVVTW